MTQSNSRYPLLLTLKDRYDKNRLYDLAVYHCWLNVYTLWLADNQMSIRVEDREKLVKAVDEKIEEYQRLKDVLVGNHAVL